MRRGLLAAACLAAGCVDFVEPDLPELGRPASFEALIVVADTGTAELSAVLVPGLDAEGLRRPVRRDSVEVLGRSIASDSILFNGTRRYHEIWSVPASAVVGPVGFRAPSLDAVRAAPPAVEWWGLRRDGPPEIDGHRGEDLVLRLATGAGAGQPEPEIRQWFLRLAGEDGAFGLSVDGVPPDTIQIPARWIPDGDEIEVRLIFSQSAVLRPPPGDYVGVIKLDTRLYWTVRMHERRPALRP